jgi:N6-adenosine-specific RNA methylase IME4
MKNEQDSKPPAIPPLPPATGSAFRCVVADPPWKYRDKVNSETMNHVHRFGYGADKIRGRRGADGYYPTMTMDEILAMPVGAMAEKDAHLYLWTTNAFMVEGHQVCKAWGFTPRTILTWAKGRVVDERLSLQIGMGSYLRNVTEHVIFAVRGSLRCNVKNVPTLLLAPRTRHSEKPAAFYDLVERCTSGPYLELFARRKRHGWASWGNEIASDVEMPNESSSATRPDGGR